MAVDDMTSLATIIHARQDADRRRDRYGRPRISPPERDRIIDLLTKEPLPEVSRRTGRAMSTLAKIATDAGL